jgi:HSP20 family protein
VLFLSEDKKKMYYYYGGKEKKAGEIKKEAEGAIAPYRFGETMQRDFDQMMQQFQREFEDFWKPGRRHRHRYPMMPFGANIPSMDLEDRGKDFRLTADLPGFSKEDVEIEIADDSVVIQAKKTQAEEEKQKNYVRKERSAQTFYRRMYLPAEVRSDDAKASLNNGILEIILPKKEPKETKKLKIV